MPAFDETALLKELLVSRPDDPRPDIAWMSVARAIGVMSEAPQGNSREVLRLAHAYIDDGSSSSMLEKLERAKEEVLGVIPMDDGREYFVFTRDQTGGFMDFSAVYLMSTQFVVFGIYRTEYSGLFKKKLRITALRESRQPHELYCSDVGRIRYVGDLDRLIGFVSLAGTLHTLFPREAVPAFALRHWWIPLRKWLH